MKIRFLSTVALAAGLITAAHAVGPGFYLGVQGGMTNTHNLPITVPTNTTPAQTATVNPSNTGAGGRLFLGNNINPYFALEGGYTYYAKSTYSLPSSAAVTCSNSGVKQSALDFVGKGMFPVSSFNLYAKAGMALVYQSLTGSCTGNPSNGSSGNISSTQTTGRPVVGVGMSYDLNQNWVADLSFTRVLSGSKIQNADLAALGISYHFTDKYCGQFLC